MQMSSRILRWLLSICLLGVGVAVVLAAGTPGTTTRAVAAEGIETYVGCGLTQKAAPAHVCHLSEGHEFGAFFRSPTEVIYTVCVEFPTGQRLCAEEQTGLAGTLYVNKITTSLPGLHRITWLVGGQQVGSWEFRIPVDPPVFGKTATAVPVSGTVLLKATGEKSFAQLQATGTIPAGTLLDTTHGTVKLLVATGSGRTASGLFRAGVFRFTQKRAPSRLKGGKTVGFTVLRLIDSLPSDCAGVSAAHRPRGRHGGRLWGNAHGPFRSEGNDATVTVRGTEWLTEDTCAGTRVKVARGIVSVYDIPRHRTVLVKAPHSYLARAGARG